MDSQSSLPRPPLIPSNHYIPPPRKTIGYYTTKNRKKIIKKYYGKKIIFVEKRAHLTAAINRSKYFLHFTIDSQSIPLTTFKSSQNRVLLHTDIIFKYHVVTSRWQYPRHCHPNIHPLQLKKALRSCKNPKSENSQFKHLQHLFQIKSLHLRVTNGSSMSQASKAIHKLRSLQSLSMSYLSDYDETDPKIPIKLKRKVHLFDPDDKKGWGFFYKISKLPRFQKLSLQTSLQTLEEQPSVIQKDLVGLYSGSHKFKIDSEIFVNTSLDIKELTAKNLVSILKTVDSLSICMGASKPAKENPYSCTNSQVTLLSEDENKKILKQGERPLKLWVLYKEKIMVNIGCLLTTCENLVSLYLKISGVEVIWDQDYGDLSNKLQTVVLDVDFLGLKYELMNEINALSRFQIEEEIFKLSRERKVKFHSGIVQLIKQLKTRAEGLETLTLFMCFANFKKSWYQPREFKGLFDKMIEEKATEFLEELESFDKFHRIDLCLCKETGYLDEWLNRILAVKSLKIVQTRSCKNH